MSPQSRQTELLTQSYEMWDDEEFLRRCAGSYLGRYCDGLNKIDYGNIHKFLSLSAEEVSRLDEDELARTRVNATLAELGMKLISAEDWGNRLSHSQNDRKLAMLNAVRTSTGAAPVSKVRWDRDHEIAESSIQSHDREIDDPSDNLRSKKLLLAGTVLLSFIVLNIAAILHSPPQQQESRTPSQAGGSTVQPALVPPPQSTPIPQTNRNLEWYEGGTLHNATLAEWVKADSRNQLATAADWAARMAKEKGIRVNSMSELLLPSYELHTCMRTGTIKEPGVSSAAWESVLRTTKAVDGAALCIAMLESQPGSYFSR